MAPSKRTGSANSGSILDDHDVEVEEAGLAGDGPRDVAAAGDHQLRPAGHRFDEQLAPVVEGDEPGGAVPHLLDAGVAGPLVLLARAERPEHPPAGEDQRPPVEAQGAALS